MLTALVDRLMCPGCREPEAPLSIEVFAPGDEGHVRTGVLVCPACSRWYPIDDDLLDLTADELADAEDRRVFSAAHTARLSALGLDVDGPRSSSSQTAPATEIAAKLKQREVFDWYAGNDSQTYTQYARTPFWSAFDKTNFERWTSLVPAGEWVIDMGSANGRGSFHMLSRGRSVAGFDISKRMVRDAINRARREGVHGRTTFFVGDASRPPLRDGSFGCVLVYGVLHHLEDPADACRDALRVLRPGGVYLGCENNRTRLRGAFDALMRVKQLWVEEAGEEPLISGAMIQDWISGLGCRLAYRNLVFVPPHAVNLLRKKWGARLLRVTDWVGSRTPGVRSLGGLLVFEIEKPISAP